MDAIALELILRASMASRFISPIQEESTDTMTCPLASQILMEAGELSYGFSIVSYTILLSITGYFLVGRVGTLSTVLLFIYYNKFYKIRNIYVEICVFKQETK